MVQSEGEVGDSGRRMVVVIDDSRAWGEGLAHLVRSVLGEDAWSCAPSGLSSGDLADVDVVVLGDGVEALSELVSGLRSQAPLVKVIVLWAPDAPEVDGVAAEVADVVLSRETTGETFVQVVRSLLDGEAVDSRFDGPRLVHSVPGARLTRAEARVLRHVAAGHSNGEIAGSLGISTNTVRTHVQRVTGKLGADSRLRAIALARESGVLDPPPTTATGP